jgi:methionine-rich copper-binding protein CopC
MEALPRRDTSGGHITMKKKIPVALLTLTFLLNSSSAFGHAQLTDSNPARGKTINVMPDLIWVEFDGNLMVFGDKNPNVIKVTDSKNKRVDSGGSLVGGARLSTHIKQVIKAGRYLISYRVVSEDGHPVEGSFYFYYKP